MHFALLVPNLPHVQEARAQYDALLALHSPERRKHALIARLWAALRTRLR
jgi:hypothetical protein